MNTNIFLLCDIPRKKAIYSKITVLGGSLKHPLETVYC